MILVGGGIVSGYFTHATVGATCGLALATVLEHVWPERLRVLSAALPFPMHLDPLVPGGAAGAILVVASGWLALLSDIDEPNSFIARRARGVLTIAGMVVGALIAWLLTAQWLRRTGGAPPALSGTDRDIAAELQALIGALLSSAGGSWSLLAALGFIVGGGAIGSWIGTLVLKGIRAGAGGHRRLTHSWVPMGALALGAVGLWWVGLEVWAGIPAALAWAILTHGIADYVTPAGVPIAYPFSEKAFHLLPRPLRPVGEPIIFSVAVITAGILVVLHTTR